MGRENSAEGCGTDPTYGAHDVAQPENGDHSHRRPAPRQPPPPSSPTPSDAPKAGNPSHVLELTTGKNHVFNTTSVILHLFCVLIYMFQ